MTEIEIEILTIAITPSGVHIAPCGIKGRPVKEYHHSPVKFKRHIDIKGFFRRDTVIESEFPDVLSFQTQSTQYFLQLKPLFSFFFPESDKVAAYIYTPESFILVKFFSPLSELGQNAPCSFRQLFLINRLIRGR
jgi:hypothetical protein